MKPHPTKSKPRIAKPSPRQPVKGGRVMWAATDKSGTLIFSDQMQAENFSEEPCIISPVLVLPISPEARNSRRWLVEQTYLRCHDAEITDPWEIADLVLRALGDTPAGEGRGK